MKNIVHTLTLAQMRANPRRTLVTLVGVVLSVTMLTAVFAGADSFLNLLYRQAAQDNGTWHGRAFETGEQVVENLSQDDRIDQLGLAASWGVSPLDDSNRWGAALYGVNQSFLPAFEGRVSGRKSSFHRERTGHFSNSRQKDRLEDWRPSLFGFVTSMDPTGGGFRRGNDLSANQRPGNHGIIGQLYAPFCGGKTVHDYSYCGPRRF